ncbi:cytoskeleton-associated protein 4 [Spea bombifrons]|uniref:cytoskeleton-associated protein 4 n=1 Tax=Spea bombifrons TaxID=233779 RepID=UPI00234961E6|nr:cytoskeleton-associated protein 4 [Spea bombifrons]
MSNARQRNKGSSPDSSSQAAASDVARKGNKPKGSPASGAGSGAFWKLLTFLFYASLVAVSACLGLLVYNLLSEVAQMNSKLHHLSEQKGELAETVDTLQKQVELLQKTVGRVEFISKDIQEKQLLQDSSIKKSEKELDQVGVILKKLQKDLSSVIQDVTAQGDRDLIQFENTMSEKFTELNNSINENIAEISKVQKSSQDEIKNVKAKLASLGEFDYVKEDLKLLKETTSELKTSLKSKEESVEWLMNNALNGESVTSNSNDIEQLKVSHNDLKRGLEAQVTAVEDLKDKVSRSEESNVKNELERLIKEFDQISLSVSEMENNYVSANNDLLKEIESNKDSIESKLSPLENIVESLTGQVTQQLEKVEAFKASFDEYSRRLNAVEEAYTGLKALSSSGGEPAAEALSALEEGQQALSHRVDELKSSVAELPNVASEFEKLQVDLTSVLEAHRNQIEELKDDYDQWKVNTEQTLNEIGSSDRAGQVPNDGLQSSVSQLETDLKMLRTAVDSLVAYSVKIETNEKELASVKDSLEDLRQSSDKLLVKLEQIQEKV